MSATTTAAVPRGGATESTTTGPSGLPWASCSVYSQAGRRALLQAATTCPSCGAGTVHRIPGPEIDGLTRKGACGHRYRLRPRRFYGPRSSTRGAP
jgi:hypothetical protein